MCKLIKEENALFNSSIRNAKINHLNHRLREFKDKHGVPNDQNTT